MSWKPDERAVKEMVQLAHVLFVHGRVGGSWSTVCEVLGVTVPQSFTWLFGRVPRSRKMCDVIKRYKAIRAAACAEAMRRMKA